MTTAISLQFALVFVASLAVYGAADALGAPRWVAMLAAGFACAAAAGIPALLKRLRARRAAADPAPDPREFGTSLAARLRLFTTDRELGDRGLHCVLAFPGADLAPLLSAAEFTCEPVPLPGGPTWSLWRRRGLLLLEIPTTYLDEAQDDAWQRVLDLLPRRLLRRWSRGAVVVAPWAAFEAAEAAALDRWAELARGRLRAWARRLDLALPVHLAVASAGAPALTPLLAPPLRAGQAGPWGFRLPFTTDPPVCRAAVAAEFEALAAAFAGRVAMDLGAPLESQADLAARPAGPRDLLPLLPRLRRLAAPAARLCAGLLAGAPSLHTIWPRGVFLLGTDAPLPFVEGLLTGVLARDGELVRPHAGAQRRRRRLQCAAGLTLTASFAAAGLGAVAVHRRNHELLADLKQVAATLPIAPGVLAPSQLKALRELDGHLAEFRPWFPPLRPLATAAGQRQTLRSVYSHAVHQALFLPTLERAQARLCPAKAPPLSDADAPDVAALLELYVLGTRLPGQNGRTAAELELASDPARRDAVVVAGAAAAWAREPGLPSGTRADIADLLAQHVPGLLQNPRLHPRREESCVRQARERLQAWRETACSLPGLAALVPGRHELRELLQSPHVDALARPDTPVPAVYTVAGFAELTRALADPRPRCGLGGFSSGHKLADDIAAAEARRRDLFTRYAEAYVGEWERLLGDLAVADPRHGCADLPNLLRRLSAGDGPLRKLFDVIVVAAVPPAPDAPDGAWHRPAADTIRAALRVYGEPVATRGADKPAIDGLLQGLDKLRGLIGAGPSLPRSEADLKYGEAKALADNAASLLDLKVANLLLRLVQPTFDHAFRCIDSQEGTGLDPWCAEVAAPYARGLGDAYPFSRDAVRDVQLPELCAFYCPQRGAAWTYYNHRLAAVLLATGNGRFVANDSPGFVSFRSYNPAVAAFYARTWQLSNLLFPFGDADRPALRLSVYIPPIDLPGVEVEEIRLVVDGHKLSFTNARERWHELTWPGEQNAGAGADAVLYLTGRYHGQPFTEQLEERGAWALFRLLERADEAAWSGEHLRFRYTFDALHGLAVDLELDAGAANELLLDRRGRLLAAFRSPNAAPPLQLRRKGTRCPL
jgi:type VI protein secretion system component VasK